MGENIRVGAPRRKQNQRMVNDQKLVTFKQTLLFASGAKVRHPAVHYLFKQHLFAAEYNQLANNSIKKNICSTIGFQLRDSVL